MSTNTLTVVFGGDIPLELFAAGMHRFEKLISVLSKEVGGSSAIDWYVDELASGSAIATVRGEAESAEHIERVVSAYSAVGRALERHEAIPYSPRVDAAARQLTALLNGKVTSIRFETETESSVVISGSSSQGRAYLSAFGSVEGRIETLRSRPRLSFTLYDDIDDHAVYCSLSKDQAEQLRNAWGKRVTVEGWIKREPSTGRPVEISPVERITILPEVEPGSYRRARAIAPPAQIGGPSPEAAIRRLRDA